MPVQSIAPSPLATLSLPFLSHVMSSVLIVGAGEFGASTAVALLRSKRYSSVSRAFRERASLASTGRCREGLKAWEQLCTQSRAVVLLVDHPALLLISRSDYGSSPSSRSGR